MMLMEDNYQEEREVRKKRLEAYSETIQEYTLKQSKQIIDELVRDTRCQVP